MGDVSNSINWAGVALSVGQYSVPRGSTLGSNGKLYSSFWRNGSSVSTMRSSKALGGIGGVVTGMGVIAEGIQVYEGEVDGGKFLIDTGMAGLGLLSPLGAGANFLWQVADPLTLKPGDPFGNPAQKKQYTNVNGQKRERCF